MRTTIRTSIAKVSMALSAVCLLGAGLHAQSYQAIAKIPFSFQTVNAVLPAGEYRVERSDRNIARFRNLKTGASTFFVTSAGEGIVPKQSGAVVFHRYGSEYFLAEIWSPSGITTKAPVTKREKELMRGANSLASVIVPVGVRAD